MERQVVGDPLGIPAGIQIAERPVHKGVGQFVQKEKSIVIRLFLVVDPDARLERVAVLEIGGAFERAENLERLAVADQKRLDAPVPVILGGKTEEERQLRNRLVENDGDGVDVFRVGQVGVELDMLSANQADPEPAHLRVFQLVEPLPLRAAARGFGQDFAAVDPFGEGKNGFPRLFLLRRCESARRGREKKKRQKCREPKPGHREDHLTLQRKVRTP